MEDGTDESERFNEEEKDDSSGEDNPSSDVASLSSMPSFDYSERPPPYLEIEEIPSYRWLESHSSFARSEPDEGISPRKSASSTSPSVASISSHTSKRRKNPSSFRWKWWLSPAVRKERNTSLTSLQEDTRLSDILTGIYQFTFKEIRTATNDFHNIIGKGSFTTTFKGFLPRHNQIAVKLFTSEALSHPDALRNATHVSSRLRHRNITSFLGYCKHKNKFMLIYEYQPNGSIRRLLFSEGEGEILLNWRIRYKICLQTANGLANLHSERIIHRNIKPSNILLDADFVPKIDDFYLAKRMSENITHLTTGVRGTLGYVDPEYLATGHLTDKTDVFSYGVVILNIVSGKRAFDRSRITEDESSVFILNKLHETLNEQGNLLQFVDPRLGSYDEEEALTLLKLSALCTKYASTLRPSIHTVVSVLEGKLKVEELIDDPWQDDYEQEFPCFSEEEMDDVETNDDVCTAPPTNILTGTIYQFTVKEIRTATNDFHNIIGKGCIKTTFKGFLPPHNQIAIKIFNSKSVTTQRLLQNDTHASSRLRHRNITSFLGYCINMDKFMLIYEYQPNGSLDRLLFSEGEGETLLNWRIRYKICLQTANGLAYLHNERIIHGHIKPSNILLDADFVPKIDDFYLAVNHMCENITHLTTCVAGTLGYLPPEYWKTGHLTDKTDVFSYGVVILEIVSGKRAYDRKTSTEYQYHVHELHETLNEQGNLLQFVDPRLGSYDEEEALTLLKLSALCTKYASTLRPSIHTVVSVLEGKLKVEELIHQQPEDVDYYEPRHFSSLFSGESEIDDVETSDDGCTTPPMSEVNTMIPSKQNVMQEIIEPMAPSNETQTCQHYLEEEALTRLKLSTLCTKSPFLSQSGGIDYLVGKLKVEDMIHEEWQNYPFLSQLEIDDVETTSDDVCTAPPTSEVNTMIPSKENDVMQQTPPSLTSTTGDATVLESVKNTSVDYDGFHHLTDDIDTLFLAIDSTRIPDGTNELGETTVEVPEAFDELKTLVLSTTLKEALNDETKSKILHLCEVLEDSILSKSRSSLVHHVRYILSFTSELSIAEIEDTLYVKKYKSAQLKVEETKEKAKSLRHKATTLRTSKTSTENHINLIKDKITKYEEELVKLHHELNALKVQHVDDEKKLEEIHKVVASDAREITQLAKWLGEESGKKVSTEDRLKHIRECFDQEQEEWKRIQVRFS